MAQNFLYMFEFVVDDLFITKPNLCAPEEFPTCCEISFRNSVFVSICDREFGQCLDPYMPKCGKCCLFSLESPITDVDKLLIHIYKKKNEKCKFLLGCTDLPIRFIFDKVMENFDIENPKWQEVHAKHIKSLPNSEETNKTTEIIDNDCDSNEEGRREQLCPTSELTKRLLPLFNLKGCQTGNLVLLIRLVANGPAIVSTFTFSRICNAGCDNKSPICDQKFSQKNKPCSCHPYAGCYDDDIDETSDNVGNKRISGEYGHENIVNTANSRNSKQYTSYANGRVSMREPSDKKIKKLQCQRYFACNADKGYPCDDIEDECQKYTKCIDHKQKMDCCPPSEQSTGHSYEEFVDECNADSCALCQTLTCEPCSGNTCDDCVKNSYSPHGQCMEPCYQTPRLPNPGPEAYDEFEACLNGSALVIRVLKDTHQVENICNGADDFKDDNDSDFDKNDGKEITNKTECSLSNMLQCNNFTRNYIKRSTGGHIVNHPNLPKIRANIKYSGNDNCYSEKYHVPYSKIKSHCDNQFNKINNYRSYRSKDNRNESDTFCQSKHRKNEQNCCVQVDRQDIRNTMKGFDVDTRKKGIEVCYKTCEETDSDVFLVKLGSKHKRERKNNCIEIELMTPKLPLILPKQHVTTETQINETELNTALSDIGKGKKGKGKKKKNLR